MCESPQEQARAAHNFFRSAPPPRLSPCASFPGTQAAGAGRCEEARSMACKDGVCPEEGDGDSDAPRLHRDPRPLFLFGDLVSASVRGAEKWMTYRTPRVFSSQLLCFLILVWRKSVDRHGGMKRPIRRILLEFWTDFWTAMTTGCDLDLEVFREAIVLRTGRAGTKEERKLSGTTSS